MIPSRWLPEGLRPPLLRLAGIPVGAGTRIEHSVFFKGGRVRIGEGCYLNSATIVDPGSASVEIGDGVAIGAGAVIAAATHDLGPSANRAAANRSEPVVIGTGAWLGARVVVLPGVTIGRGAVIGAGAVVTRDCAPDASYAGVPARLLRELDQGSGGA
ncbi:acyltransferase [Petropleomorpha daqingensis]|uniref:Maltose O-acetyltransferase n=1 Tax=Petropleomorpha daqingensis TaxID=2026353 RepID=A0A853CCY1_9ACTN|nr:maltose O-acetyltransferase [Petropleomorpha daqingensis]